MISTAAQALYITSTSGKLYFSEFFFFSCHSSQSQNKNTPTPSQPSRLYSALKSSDVMIINNAVAQEAKRNREVIGKRRRDKAVLFVKFANFSLIFIAKLPF